VKDIALDALAKDVAAMEEALQPFAMVGKDIFDETPGALRIHTPFTADQFRAAHLALAAAAKGQGKAE
jgi:hypothetical protein